MEMSERFLFTLANNGTPMVKRNSNYVRTFLARDLHTGAWDGQHAYIYGNDEKVFANAFHRLHTNMSPILKAGHFQIKILTKNALPDLPTEMPNCAEYENIVPLQCSWCNLLKT